MGEAAHSRRARRAPRADARRAPHLRRHTYMRFRRPEGARSDAACRQDQQVSGARPLASRRPGHNGRSRATCSERSIGLRRPCLVEAGAPVRARSPTSISLRAVSTSRSALRGKTAFAYRPSWPEQARPRRRISVRSVKARTDPTRCECQKRDTSGSGAARGRRRPRRAVARHVAACRRAGGPRLVPHPLAEADVHELHDQPVADAPCCGQRAGPVGRDPDRHLVAAGPVELH